MKHLGDISKVNGAEIEPVDIITFGSPCQDLSVAGKRAGLKHEANGDEETTRSGLFMEAVRIIKEMRKATNGIYPRFALWENVPGAFSSNKGEDFRIVCEELIKIIEPSASMPGVPAKGWPYSDSYIGDGWSLAYRVFDAQYWGVPQRRRRIHLVVDFRGQCAREILFEREGVRGYFAEGRAPWQGIASHAEGGPLADDREGEASGGDRGRQLDAVGCDLYNHVETGDKAVTITTQGGGTASGPSVVIPVAYTMVVRSGCDVDAKGKPAGKGALVQTEKASTINTVQDQYLFQPTAYGFDQGATRDVGVLFLEEQSKTLANGTCPGHHNGVVIAEPVVAIDKESFSSGVGFNRKPGITVGGPCATLQASGGAHAVAFQTYQTVTGPLMANSHPGSYTGQDAFSDMLVAGKEETPVVLDRAFFNQGQNAQYDPQLYTDGTVPTLIARGPSAVQVRYIVRRLTPTECARLQGFADWWGHIEHKTDLTDEELSFWLDVRNTHAAINGKAVKDYNKTQMLTWYNKLWTDAAEYKMWGNGIALPPALYCMQGITDVLTREEDDSWML
jgi:DNA (cytosine-5)-methyltransferase 1